MIFPCQNNHKTNERQSLPHQRNPILSFCQHRTNFKISSSFFSKMQLLSYYTSSDSASQTDSDSSSDADADVDLHSNSESTSKQGPQSARHGPPPITNNHLERPSDPCCSSDPSDLVAPEASATASSGMIPIPQRATLPAVLPLRGDGSRPRFLLHVQIPIPSSTTALPSSCAPSCPVQAFVRYLESRTRLRMVGHHVKASLTSVNHQFHISLSRPVFVSCDDVHSVMSALRTAVSDVPRATVCLAANVIALLNGKGRRLFFAAPVVSSPCERKSGPADKNLALVLIDVINSVFRKHRLPTHYEHPIPHLSFAYTETLDVLPLFHTDNHAANAHPTLASGSTSPGTNVPSLSVDVSAITCTVGKSRYTFKLRDLKDSAV